MSEEALQKRFHQLQEKKTLSQKYIAILDHFFHSYLKEISKTTFSPEECASLFHTFLDLILEQKRHPHLFSLYHKKIRSPFDYYQFGMTFLKPLVDMKHSSIRGQDQLKLIQKYLEAKDNVILLANHQTEYDPQAISILLDESFPKLAQNIIYVAGERVITDPLAIPFSMGCDLLCIYSKQYINTPPEQKEAKLQHNRKTMDLMCSLLKEGSKIIYVAPSGGRDRINAQGIVEIAPFDPQSIEMFYLMAKKSKRVTHFYPFSLDTYHLLPPPPTRQLEMGEMRTTSYAPLQLFFGEEFDMETMHDSDKKRLRQKRADVIYQIVLTNYEKLLEKKL
ncbi:MAG: 1-acyl-sn-glycerol-3-phosphate acyltransferase [Parachlamydiales bacterium]|nr:1-acyl-sn-glycerol-3-phosphate acyltransferase [Parachlamydiales bacterium]